MGDVCKSRARRGVGAGEEILLPGRSQIWVLGKLPFMALDKGFQLARDAGKVDPLVQVGELNLRWRGGTRRWSVGGRGAAVFSGEEELSSGGGVAVDGFPG